MIHQQVKMMPRGIGKGWIECFICGHQALSDGLGEGSCHDELAAFVDSKEDGETVLEMFKRLGLVGVVLDYRPYEPNWIQVKVGACALHRPNLNLLSVLASKDKSVTERTLDMCIPKPNPVRTEEQLAQVAKQRRDW